MVSGSSFPDVLGRRITDLAVFTYDPGTATYVPVPFQIDERVDKLFNPGTPYAFHELVYDIGHEEDGLLDENDELAVMFGDAGVQRASTAAPWPANAETVSFEIAVTDPREGVENPTRYVYLFVGGGLGRSSTRYLNWTPSPVSNMWSDRFELDFTDRWQMTGFRVLAPCGTGRDILDRVKGRARTLQTMEEDEDGWNENSEFLGGLVGPVRAIRYVRGATSGVNTIHHDVVYRNFWLREVNLRVHPLPEVRLYLDWLPGGTGAMTFLPQARTGLPLDGTPDTVTDTFAAWSVTRTANGGAITVYDVPASTLYTTKKLYYRDDRNYDDVIKTNPVYGDDDNSAYGDVGIVLSGLGDSQLNPIVMRWRVYPLCANDGTATLGDAYLEMKTEPLEQVVTPRRTTISSINTLQARRIANDVVLSWQSLAGVDGYRVFTAPQPGLPHASWTRLSDVTATGFTDSGEARAMNAKYYSVVAYKGSVEGSW